MRGVQFPLKCHDCMVQSYRTHPLLYNPWCFIVMGSIHCYINIMFVVFQSYGILSFDQHHVSSVSKLWDRPVVL